MLWDFDPVDRDWHRWDAIGQAAERAAENAERIIERNRNAVLTAATFVDWLPYQLRGVASIADLAEDCAASGNEIVGAALYPDEWGPPRYDLLMDNKEAMRELAQFAADCTAAQI